MTFCSNHNKCVEESFQNANAICNKYDLRFTDLRKKVFSMILKSYMPSKAYDILNILQKEDSSAKPSTVYRTLDFLLEYGLIHKLHVLNSYVACSHPLKHKKCSFLICKKCNQVKECCNENLNKELENIGFNNNFRVEDSTVELRGVCISCNV